MKLTFADQVHSFRSPGLFVFLQLLKAAHPGWVDLAQLAVRMPGTPPRQLARFVDSLEAAGLPLLEYETKTRGRYRLAVAPGELLLSGNSGLTARSLPTHSMRSPPAAPRAAGAEPPPLALDALASPRWVEWVLCLALAYAALQGGQISGTSGALHYLALADSASADLPAWAKSVARVACAHALARASRYREAGFCLREVDTAARNGALPPGVTARAWLTRAKIRYDQTRYAEAAQWLTAAQGEGAAPCAMTLNMRALLSGRQLAHASRSEAPLLLAQTLSTLLEAFGAVFLGYGDASLLNALTFNYGNNLLRGVNARALPDAAAGTATAWLAANLLINRKLGTGDDSVLSNLLLIDVGIDHGYHPEHWPAILRRGLALPCSLEGLLDESLREARRVGNQLEVAQCLRRKLRLTASAQTARDAYFEACALFLALKRKDAARSMLDEWGARFGDLPVKMDKQR